MFLFPEYNKINNKPLNINDIFSFYLIDKDESEFFIHFILNKKVGDSGYGVFEWVYCDKNDALSELDFIYNKLGDFMENKEEIYFDSENNLISEGSCIDYEGKFFTVKYHLEIGLYIYDGSIIKIKDLDRRLITIVLPF